MSQVSTHLRSTMRAMPAPKAPAGDSLVYVGTYTGALGKGKGIYLFRLQTDNLEVAQNLTLVPLGLAAEIPSPSFLELDPKRRLLFAVNELDTFAGQPSGAVSAFAIGPAGQLTLINRQPSRGAGPCHLLLDPAGRNLLVANYNGGSVAVLPVAPDGHLGPASDFVQHVGKGARPDRQSGPHAHGVTIDPDNHFALVCDLGLDKVLVYQYDGDKGKLRPAATPSAAVKPGAGPRHLVFRPDGRFAYVINELNSTVTVFAWNGKAGTLTEAQTVSSLPESYDGPNSGAEIAVHPSGKFLYVSNRGHNSVVLFTIDADKGQLTFVEEQGTGGNKPRHFGIQPGAKHLAIANQASDSVLACRIDAGNGRLKPSGVFAQVPAPVCVKFLPPPDPKR
jgi:6-phosphogluconolactonase